MPVRPLSPDEAAEEKAERFLPEFVVQAINALIVRNYSGRGSFTLRQDEILRAIVAAAPEGTGEATIYKNGWMDFEPSYRKAGWAISCDSPGYNESYETTYEFSKKGH